MRASAERTRQSVVPLHRSAPSGVPFRLSGMRVAVVDVGSNTARVLVADVFPEGRVEAVEERRERLGLGAEIAARGALSRDTVGAVARACKRYAKLARALGAERAETTVPAPGRQGRAPQLLVSALVEATRLPVRVLSSDEEGRLSYDGAVARASSSSGLTGVVDVGGGSTEIVLGDAWRGAVWVRSIDLGSIRLTRQCLHGDPPSRRELRRARDAVHAATSALAPSRPDRALATGGSARAVAKIVGPVFDAEDVGSAVDLFARRPSAKVARAAGIHPVRAASVLGGALLLAETSRVLDRPLELARGGVREGAALALAGVQASAAA
jgi:exopolyphosphatase/guanosine-5'-triphosphate,3'-diphosphate pyrophosphatase